MIRTVVHAVVSKAQTALQAQPDAAPTQCPALRSDEFECKHDAHRVSYYWGLYRLCPLTRYREELERLRGPLDLCGYKAERGPVHEALWRSLDAERDVRGLPELREAIAILLKRGPTASGHLALIGTVGTAKTHALLLLYFWSLWHGVKAVWLTSSELRDLAQELRSFDDERHASAQGRLLFLASRQLLVIDDLGDQLSDLRAREGGSTAVAGLVQDLLNRTGARLFWSSNLGVVQVAETDNETRRSVKRAAAMDELRKHADLGPRVVDRLFADHRGEPAIRVQLEGQSQRHHQARTQRRGKNCDA